MTSKKSSRPGSGPSVRQLRVGENLRHTLADILRREDLPDRAVDPMRLAVTEVRVSPDLKNATAFIAPLGGEGGDLAIEALTRHAKFLRGHLARRVDLKFTPSLTFELDRSFDEADRIESLLQTDKVRQDLDEPPTDETP